MDRRGFIKLSAALTGAGSYLLSCTPSPKKINGKIVGASANIGHLLRDKKITAPTSAIQKQIVIVGGGISGLSAGWYLQKQGVTDFVILDLEATAGGNAAYGSNAVSAYPWGAHYIPTPNNNLKEYLGFLQEAGVITAISKEGIPTYNERFLCFDPQERLYINGQWQDGLVPHFGVPDEEVKQINRFMLMMDRYRQLKDKSGKDVFAIPVNDSSTEEEYIALDKITMEQWLQSQQLTSAYLHRYVNYCCRDDFGTPADRISAWTGIHYFASRKGKGTNAEHGDVLTWPEGNGFLAGHLQMNIKAQVLTNALGTQIINTPNGVTINYIDTVSHKTTAIEAKQCIIAVPQFVAARLLHDDERLKQVHAHLQYSPWMVANLQVNKLEERSGAPLSWDNVIHESKSLGYVEANHELLQQDSIRKNLTYYFPLTDQSPAEERKQAQARTHGQWVKLILDDLRKVHPNIEKATENIDIMLWGHAMAQPLPGIIHGEIRKQLAASIDNKIHFAHTDLAGISIFEEGFYQGIGAAKKVNSLLS